MQHLLIPSSREGIKEDSPLVIALISGVEFRRRIIPELIAREYREKGCVESNRNRDCSLYIDNSPNLGLLTIESVSPELVICDSRYSNVRWNIDGIWKVINPLRRRMHYNGKILVYGFWAVEKEKSMALGADEFIEEDELEYEKAQLHLCNAIRYLLECRIECKYPGFGR